mgnify:CR=1 FL=1
MRTLAALSLAALSLAAAASLGACRSDAVVTLENGNRNELMVYMTEDERACMRAKCSDAMADEDTWSACFKDTCRSEAGQEERGQYYRVGDAG